MQEAQHKPVARLQVTPGLLRLGDVVPHCLGRILAHPVSHQWHVLGILVANPQLIEASLDNLDWFTDSRARSVAEQLLIVARHNDVSDTSRIITILVDRLADARPDWESITTQLVRACELAEAERLPKLLLAIEGDAQHWTEGGESW